MKAEGYCNDPLHRITAALEEARYLADVSGEAYALVAARRPYPRRSVVTATRPYAGSVPAVGCAVKLSMREREHIAELANRTGKNPKRENRGQAQRF